RRIAGVGPEFDKIIRFDERDAVADTNEFEYAVVNRFFVTRSISDVSGRRRRRYYRPPMMEPERPASPLISEAERRAASSAQSDAETMPAEAEAKGKMEAEGQPKAGAAEAPKSEEESATRPRRVLRGTLETGEQAELRKRNAVEKGPRQSQRIGQGGTSQS